MANQYAKRNVIALGNYYTRHVSAMTEEDLHEKSDIAAELAYRDKQIDALVEDLIKTRGWLKDVEQAAGRLQHKYRTLEAENDELRSRAKADSGDDDDR